MQFVLPMCTKMQFVSPLETARRCRDMIDLAEQAVASGIQTAVSDAVVAALMARASADGSVLNVLINLASIHDVSFKNACRDEARPLMAEVADRTAIIIDAVRVSLAQV